MGSKVANLIVAAAHAKPSVRNGALRVKIAVSIGGLAYTFKNH